MPMGMPGGRRRGPMVVEKPKNFKKTVARLLKYIGRNKLLLLVMILCVIATASVALLSPTMQSDALNYLTPISVAVTWKLRMGSPLWISPP